MILLIPTVSPSYIHWVPKIFHISKYSWWSGFFWTPRVSGNRIRLESVDWNRRGRAWSRFFFFRYTAGSGLYFFFVVWTTIGLAAFCFQLYVLKIPQSTSAGLKPKKLDFSSRLTAWYRLQLNSTILCKWGRLPALLVGQNCKGCEK